MAEFTEKFLNRAKTVPWLSIGLGVCATIIGIILTATNARATTDDSNLYLILGGVLTAFGPVAISHAVSKDIGRNEVRENMQAHIRAVSMNLGQSLTNLSHALGKQIAGADDARTTLRLVESVVPGIEVQITELQRLVGSPFSAEDQLVTKEQMKPLMDDLQKAYLEGDTESMKDTTVKIQRGLRKTAQSAAATARENVPCIECENPVVCDVGVTLGSTARVTCDSCDTAFNVHRGTDGLFVKALHTRTAPSKLPEAVAQPTPAVVRTALESQALESDRLTVVCPICATSYEVSGTAAKWPKTVICFTCSLGLAVDEQATVLASTKFEEKVASIVRFFPKGVVVECPDCGRERRCGYRRAGAIHGFCINDKLVFSVSTEMATAWRAQEEANAAAAE